MSDAILWAVGREPMSLDWTTVPMTGPPFWPNGRNGVTEHTELEPPAVCPWYCPDDAGRCFYCLQTEAEHTPRALGK